MLPGISDLNEENKISQNGSFIQQKKLVPLYSAFVLNVYPGFCLLTPLYNSWLLESCS